MKPPPACPFPISHQLLEDLCKSQLMLVRRSEVQPTEANNNCSQGEDSKQKRPAKSLRCPRLFAVICMLLLV